MTTKASDLPSLIDMPFESLTRKMSDSRSKQSISLTNSQVALYNAEKKTILFQLELNSTIDRIQFTPNYLVMSLKSNRNSIAVYDFFNKGRIIKIDVDQTKLLGKSKLYIVHYNRLYRSC